MSSLSAEHRSRKRPLEHDECEEDSDSEVEVVDVKRIKPNQGVLSHDYLKRGLNKVKDFFKGSMANDFTKNVFSALKNLGLVDFTASSESSDSENMLPEEDEFQDSYEQSPSPRHFRRHKKEHVSYGEYSPLSQKTCDSFVTISHGPGKQTTITTKFSPGKHKTEIEIEGVIRPSGDSMSKSRWSTDRKCGLRMPKQQVISGKISRHADVDLTDENGQASSSKDVGDDDDLKVIEVLPKRSSMSKLSRSLPVYKDERKLSCLTPDIQFIRSPKVRSRTPFLKEWSNGNRPFGRMSTFCSDSSRWYKGNTPTGNSFGLKKNSFTTNTVMRIQEKEQYKMLIEQFSCFSIYKPMVKPPESKSVEVQVSLDKSTKPAFMKETIYLPSTLPSLFDINKPCQLLPKSQCLEKKSPKKLEEVIIDDEDEEENDDDEPVIIEAKSRSLPSETLGIFSPEWIKELKKTVAEETEERLKIEEELWKKCEARRKQREAKYAERKRLQQLQLSGPVIPETIEPEREHFPEITPEMEATIERALRQTNSTEVLSKLNEIQITPKDLDTLSGLNWLNDEIINFYLNLIVERSKQPSYPSVYAFNSFFFPTLRTRGYQSVKRWTRKVDIFSYDIILVPLHQGVHWCLAVIDFRYKKVQFYDSMQGKEACFELLRDYLISESLDKKKKEFDLSGWCFESVKDIPSQRNGSDCGMFTLKYAEYITRDAKISFTQDHMEYFRRRLIYEILIKSLL